MLAFRVRRTGGGGVGGGGMPLTEPDSHCGRDQRSTKTGRLRYSKAANALVGLNTFRGMVTCCADPGEAGRIPDLKAGFLVDGAKLYALAQQHGADLPAKGFHVEIQTAASPETRHATWSVNFSDANSQDGGLSIIEDANTGKVENLVRH